MRHFLFFLILLCYSCKEKPAVEPQQLSATESLLVNKKWVLYNADISPAFDFDGKGNPSTDAYAHLAPCVKDGWFIFNADGTMLINEGELKCHPDDLQSRNSSWYLNEAQALISFDAGSYKLVKAADSSFIVSYVVNSNGLDYLRTYFYRQQ